MITWYQIMPKDAPAVDGLRQIPLPQPHGEYSRLDEIPEPIGPAPQIMTSEEIEDGRG